MFTFEMLTLIDFFFFFNMICTSLPNQGLPLQSCGHCSPFVWTLLDKEGVFPHSFEHYNSVLTNPRGPDMNTTI